MLSTYRSYEGKQNTLGIAIERICLIRIRLVIPLLRTSSTIQKSKGERGSPYLTPTTRKVTDQTTTNPYRKLSKLKDS